MDFLEKPSEVGGAGCYSPILNDENSLCFQNTMTPSSTKEVVGVEHRGLESKGSNNQKTKTWQFGGSFFWLRKSETKKKTLWSLVSKYYTPQGFQHFAPESHGGWKTIRLPIGFLFPLQGRFLLNFGGVHLQ